MDLRQLRYFVKIAELGNFSRAAELLRIAQPSLSQHVRNLEEELGADLFVRHNRGVTLTPSAQDFYEHARRILLSVERAKETFRCPADEKPKKVTLGLSTTATRILFKPLYRSLAQHEPDVMLHLVEEMPGRLDESMKAGRLDVALLYNHKPAGYPVQFEVMVEEFVLLVSPGHDLAGKREIRLEELQSTPVVLPSRLHSLRGIIDELTIEHQVEFPVIDCDSLPAMRTLVIDEGHQAIMPYSAFADEITARRAVAIPIVSPVPSWRMSIVGSPQAENFSAVVTVARILADLLNNQVKSGMWRARQVERIALEAFFV